MRWIADAMTILEWAFCERFYLIKSFFICVSNIVCKEIEQKITILHWLSSSEHDHDLKLILNLLDSRNIELTFEDMILHKTQYHCSLQSNSYTWKQWEVHHVSNTVKTVQTASNVIWFEKQI